MADRARDRGRGGARTSPRLPAVLADNHEVLTASAQTLFGAGREQFAVQYKSWQKELWAYSRSVGEFGSLMNWFASGISRMHLVAGHLKVGSREPEVLPTGPPAALVEDLIFNAKGGETQYMRKWGRQVGIPGVGYFVAWDTATNGDDSTRRVYDVKSADQIRRSTQPFRDAGGRIIKRDDGAPLTGYDLRTAPDQWRKLPLSSLVGRIYWPDDEYDYEASSWARPALTTLREIDLLNRHIIATLLSRLVFNGLLLIPEEVTFPVNPQFKDAADPFIAELVAIASRGIKDPGSPGSAIPVPIRVPEKFIDKFKHLIIATGVDPKVIEAREAAITNLSRVLPAPPEALTGKSDMNHWNAWEDTADNVKMYFGPTLELITGGLNEIFLWPMLEAGGYPTRDAEGKYVVWYDASDLIADPDNSENAQSAHEAGTITDESYLTYLGLDADDAPSDEERRTLILQRLAIQGLPVPDSFYLLYPEDKPKTEVDPVTGTPMNSVTGAPVPVPIAAGPVNGNDPGASANGTKSRGVSGAKAPDARELAAERAKSKARSAAKPSRGG